MKVVQVALLNSHHERLTTWVDYRPDLKEGAMISLSDFKPEVFWMVTAVYKDIVKDGQDFDWHRKWTNNI